MYTHLSSVFLTLFLIVCTVVGKTGITDPAADAIDAKSAGSGDHRNCFFAGIADVSQLVRTESTDGVILTSPEIPCPVPTREVVPSWNAEMPAGSAVRAEVRAFSAGHWTDYFRLGDWTLDGQAFPRTSEGGQTNSDGAVHTDTLVLAAPASILQYRVHLVPGVAGSLPRVKLLGLCMHSGNVVSPQLPPERAAWGHEITVPGRPQTGYPGANGWCSPTSVSMVLGLWAQQTSRPELDVAVPDAARAIYDKLYDGTGNWPFNTAFAGSFAGMRAYVTRLSDIRELEEWTLSGVPPIVSVSYDLLKGKPKDEDPGHLMVCDGFASNGDIVLNDPAHHPEKGEQARRVFPRANFERAWRRSKNLVYLIYPVGTKTPEDRFGHWFN